MTRPAAEIVGRHQGYGFAGSGVNTATGNYTQTAMDLGFSGSLLAWARTYNSLNPDSGPLGRGWTTTLSAYLVTGDGGAAFHDDDGRVLSFSPDGNGGYRRPQDINADLAKAADGTFTLRYRSGETWTFDSTGRMSERRTEGESLAFGYDSAGRLASATDSAGFGLSLSYDASGRLTKAAASDGRQVSYQYSADGALASVTGPDGAVTRYTTSGGLITEVVDADGRHAVTNSYDDSGRVSHQELGGAGGGDFAYDDSTGVTTMTSTSTGAKAVYQHDPSGRLVKMTDPAGNSISQTFDDNGRLTSASSRGGSTTTLEYDARGNLVRRTTGTAATAYSYDAQDRVTSVTDPAGGVTNLAYTGDSRMPSEVTVPGGAKTTNTVVNGLVTETVDPTGAKTTYGYDDARRLTAVTDAAGQTTQYGYDAAGRRTSVRSPAGATTQYGYDAAGRVTTTTSPSGAVTRYHYTSAGLLLDTTDPSGAVTANGYDEAGRPASSTDPLGRKTTYTFDGEGNLATSTDPAGGISRYAYDSQNRLASVTDPTGVAVRYAYDADGRQTEVTEAAGTAATSYDAHGNVTATTDAAGQKTSYEYDALDRLVATTDAAGATTRTEYDAAGRVVAETDALGAVTRYTYDAAGRLIAVTDPLGNVTRYEYDAAGRLVKKTMPTGGGYQYSYDADGRLTAQTTPTGLVTRYGYDADGHLTSITDPRGGVTRYEYDARGLRTTMTSPSGAVRRMEYDAAQQLVASIDPNGSTTRYAYDVAGHLSSLTDAKGAVTRYTYDASGRVTSTTDPLGRTTRQAFDAAGNLTAVTDPSGQTLSMEYDAVGRLTRRTGADGASVSFGYDAVGRRTSMTDTTGTTGYLYDAVGRLLNVTQPDGSVFASTYDAAGRRVGLRYPDGLAIGYRYNADGVLTGMSDPRAGDVTYTVDADGRLLTEALPGKWSRNYRYTGGLLTGYQEYRNGAPSEDTTLARNADGRVTQLTEPSPGRNYQYSYDPAGQLLSATGQNGGTLKATYDAVGNRTSITRGNVQTSLSYDAADQLVAADTGSTHAAYSYDSSGRLVHRVGPNDELTIAYDSFGLPTTTTQNSGGVTQTSAGTYNGDGLLVGVATTRKPTDSPPQTSSVSYQWSAGGTPQILVQRGDDAADFVYGYGRVFADTATTTATFARDSFGSTIQTSQTAPWAQAGDYDVFGAPQSAGAPSVYNPAFGYRGELGYRGEQPIGSLLYLRARTYDASVGRFTSRDPISNFVGRADTASPYTYANNDPVDLTDPSGNIPIWDPPPAMMFGYMADDLGPDLGTPALDCKEHGSLEAHPKLFQGKGPLCARGYIPRDCLNADEICLNKLWWGHQPERAAQAFTIHELNNRREGIFDRWLQRWTPGGGTKISDQVDWEVGDRASDYATGFAGFSIDIVTEERKMFEVKRWKGASTVAEVTAQLLRYETDAKLWFDIDFRPSTELTDWASGFEVHEHVWSLDDTVYVWGLGNLPGHIYFAKEKRAPEKVRTRVEADRIWEELLSLVGVGGIVGTRPVAPAPVPEPVLAP